MFAPSVASTPTAIHVKNRSMCAIYFAAANTSAYPAASAATWHAANSAAKHNARKTRIFALLSPLASATIKDSNASPSPKRKLFISTVTLISPRFVA